MSLVGDIVKAGARRLVDAVEGHLANLESAIRDGRRNDALALVARIRDALAKARTFL